MVVGVYLAKQMLAGFIFFLHLEWLVKHLGHHKEQCVGARGKKCIFNYQVEVERVRAKILFFQQYRNRNHPPTTE